MGYISINATYDVYGHMFLGEKKDAMGLLDAD
jgi:hypothetical protein